MKRLVSSLLVATLILVASCQQRQQTPEPIFPQGPFQVERVEVMGHGTIFSLVLEEKSFYKRNIIGHLAVEGPSRNYDKVVDLVNSATHPKVIILDRRLESSARFYLYLVDLRLTIKENDELKEISLTEWLKEKQLVWE